MSLLQEALKRKENDEAQRQPETAGAEKIPVDLSHPADVSLSLKKPAANDQSAGLRQNPPPQSMPVLAPSQPAASPPALASTARRDESAERAESGEAPVEKPGLRKTSFLWVIVAAIAILAGLMVAAGFAFFLYRSLSPIKEGIGRQTHQVAKVAPIISGGTNMVIGQPIIVTPAPAQAAAMQNAGTNAVQQQSIGDAARKPVSIKQVPARTAVVRWPALKLTGILRGSGPAESTALINGKMISAGQTIDGVTIVEIQADGVLLKYGAENRFLRVGTTSY